MSKIAEYKRLEAQLAAQLAALDKLKTDDKLKREIEFETKLKVLLEDYGYTFQTVLDILDPNSVAITQQRPIRRERSLKTYTNPHTGVAVQTRGGNHKVINAWKEQYGADEVKTWAV